MYSTGVSIALTHVYSKLFGVLSLLSSTRKRVRNLQPYQIFQRLLFIFYVKLFEFQIILKYHGDDGRQANIRASVISTHLSTAICHVTYAWSCPRLNLCVKISRFAPLRQQERIFISHSAHSLVVCNYTSQCNYTYYYRILILLPVLLSPSLSFSS